MNAQEDIVKQVLMMQENVNFVSEEIARDTSARIQPYLNAMKESYNALKQLNMINQITNEGKYGLQTFLQGENEYSTHSSKAMQANREVAKQHISVLYHYTTKILSELKLINEVNYTITYFDKSGKYYRLGNFNLDPKYMSLQGKKELSLNVSRSAIKEAALKAAEEQKDAFERINAHYQDFIKPYLDWQKKAKTGWKMNRGVAVEAFERHWEQTNHFILDGNLEQNKADYGSDGRRWVLYRQSSGSAAYYTGPDTAYSQVKNYNATVIHNIDTVLNATDFIFKLFSGNINIQEQSEQIKKALSQTETMTFSQKMWDSFSQSIKTQIAKELLGTKSYKVVNAGKGFIKLEHMTIND